MLRALTRRANEPSRIPHLLISLAIYLSPVYLSTSIALIYQPPSHKGYPLFGYIPKGKPGQKSEHYITFNPTTNLKPMYVCTKGPARPAVGP